MYSHSIIQLNVAGVSMFLAVSKIALVVEIAAILPALYYKRPISSSAEKKTRVNSLGNSIRIKPSFS